MTYLEQYQPALVVEILDLAQEASALWPEGQRFYDHGGLTTSTELQWRDHQVDDH